MPWRRAGAEAVRVHTTDLLENPGLLWDYHLLAVPGGFSWGDDHGAGVILALRLKLALGSALQEFIQAGRLVIGICNGFQVLVNLGLLPGLPGRPAPGWRPSSPTTAAISGTPGCTSKSCRTGVRVHPRAGPAWNCLSATGKASFTPMGRSSGIGRPGPDRPEIRHPSGKAGMGRFPHNPNGSLLDIAGICDATGRVLGLMPHPEAGIFLLSSTPPGPGTKKPGAAGANPTRNRSAPAWPSSPARLTICKKNK
jgi:phosphoribosylformylglycinamidine synthase subunit PurQ / glutaminase